VHKKEALLCVDGRYIEAALEKSPVGAVLKKEETIRSFLKKHKVLKLGFDGKFTSYENYLHFKKWRLAKPVSISSPLEGLRLIKEKEEIEGLKKSAALLWLGFCHLQKHIKAGITEKELARIFEIFSLENGAEALAFEPIIAFGANSAMPHYRAGNTRLKKGDIVLIDIGVVLNTYHSDMTRVLFFGTPDPSLKKMYEVVKESQKAALLKAKPGSDVREMDVAAREVMKKAGMENLFLHSLGHGIGLETHEHPRIKFDGPSLKLKRGMVITVEPGLYVSGLGGVRYEDTICITETGYKNFFPKQEV